MATDGASPDRGLKVANMIKSGAGQDAAIERAPGVYESRGIGNSYLLTTPDGDVLVNAGGLDDARRGKALFASVSQNPVRYIILTQSHANQYGGLEVYKTSDNVVIAHRNHTQERHDAEMLAPHYLRGSRRIFRRITGRKDAIVPTVEVAPDLLIDGDHGFTLGGRRFEILWTPGGETRSAVIVWLPDEKIAVVGNLFGPLFGNQPNLNTMRGDKPRKATEYIASIKRLRALRPTLILTGHEDIHGAEAIEQALTRMIDSVQWIFDRTIEGMNAGTPLRTLMRDVVPPPELALTEEYGKVAWNVRAIWHEYTGWHDPARGLTDLFGVPASSVALALAEIAGGADVIAAKAAVFVDGGKPLEALHLLDIALAAAPDSAVARDVKLRALELLDQQTGGINLWERMSIAAELDDLKKVEEPGTASEMTQIIKPLAGLRVLDFTAMPPGGMCTVMLADLGAEVVRIEPPAQKDQPSLVVRQVALSRGKRSMTLDMRNSASSEILLRLAPTVDIVVENARPGAMDARGFGYAQAHAANPRIIWCAITGFGQDGPYADHSGHDLSYLAHSGLLAALAPDLPWHPGLSLSLQAGAMTAVIAIQSALLQRAASGEGAFLDVSLSEAAGWLLTAGINPLSDAPYRLSASPDRRLYACGDGRFVAVASAEPRTWSALCDGLGIPELKASLHDAALTAATTETLAKILLTRPAADWVERLAPTGAAVTIVNDASQALDDPHIRARGSIVTAAGVPVPASPVRISAPDGGHSATANEAPHRVGEDSEDILLSAGFSAAEIAELTAAGIL